VGTSEEWMVPIEKREREREGKSSEETAEN